MRIDFIKMHGLGNDFVVLDGRDTGCGRNLPMMTERAVSQIADRRTGLGCDQLILLEDCQTHDFRMRIFNADGGEVEACGNAARAVALLHGKPATVATGGGTIGLRPTENGAKVDMGEPHFGWEDVPLAYAMDAGLMPLAWDQLENPFAVNVGNPHAVFFVDDADAIDLDKLGPRIEHDPVFPQRVNVNVAEVRDNAINLHVWERGVGLTRACGTGACATAVAAISRGLIQSPVTVNLPGGALQVEWQRGGTITMRGPAAESFRGSFEWNDFA